MAPHNAAGGPSGKSTLRSCTEPGAEGFRLSPSGGAGFLFAWEAGGRLPAPGLQMLYLTVAMDYNPGIEFDSDTCLTCIDAIVPA
jgi:hypothetical protein